MIVVSVCIAIARVDWIWRVPESINEQLNVLGYKGSFCTLIIILIILSGIYMYAMFFSVCVWDIQPMATGMHSHL